MPNTRKYNYYRPEMVSGASFSDDNPLVEDVFRSFNDIRTDGDYLAAWVNDYIPRPRYTFSLENKLGHLNHFQGIQRLSTGNYFVISGSDPHSSRSHLFVCKLESVNGSSAWRSNIIETGKPPDEDGIIKVIGVNSLTSNNIFLGLKSSQWHAGGISLLGDILAVPIEGSKQRQGSRIVFYSFEDPENPQLFPFTIDRPGEKATAVALTKLPTGYYVVAVSSKPADSSRRLDFYLSKSENFSDGFREKFTTWYAYDVQSENGQERSFGGFQNINFIKQANDELFLVGMHNTSPYEPVSPLGRDYADLYSVKFDYDLLPEIYNVYEHKLKPRIAKIANKHFDGVDDQYNMDAGAGIYINNSGAPMVYACHHFVKDRMIKLIEFSPEPENFTPETINDIHAAWIELFEHHNFEGRRLSLSVNQDTTIRDYRRIYVQGGSFNDKISSTRFQIPKGTVYRLYQNKDYQGKHLDLVGTGRAEIEPDFKNIEFNDLVSSSQFIKGTNYTI